RSSTFTGNPWRRSRVCSVFPCSPQSRSFAVSTAVPYVSERLFGLSSLIHWTKNGSIDTSRGFETMMGKSKLTVLSQFIAMNKADLVDKLAAACGCTKADAERYMDKLIEEITTA